MMPRPAVQYPVTSHLGPQVSWELLQSGGGARLGAEAGVYVGIQQMEYGSLAGPFLERIGPFSATGGPFQRGRWAPVLHARPARACGTPYCFDIVGPWNVGQMP